VTAARQRDGGGGGCSDSFCPTHAPSNATDTPTYAPLSLVEDGGTTVLIVSSSATAAPMATTATVLPPSRCAPPQRFALPPPLLTLPPMLCTGPVVFLDSLLIWRIHGSVLKDLPLV